MTEEQRIQHLTQTIDFGAKGLLQTDKNLSTTPPPDNTLLYILACIITFAAIKIINNKNHNS